MLFKSFCEENKARASWQFVCTSRTSKYPWLARFHERKDWKRFDCQSHMQTWIQWIYGLNFNLILFTYICWSQPYSWTRASCHRKPKQNCKKLKKSVKLISYLQRVSKPKKDSNPLLGVSWTYCKKFPVLKLKERARTSPTVWTFFHNRISWFMRF